MAGQATQKSVKEVKACIKAIEHNTQIKGSGGGSESGSNAKPTKRMIGKC